MRRPIFKVTLYETSQILPICHFIYKEFFFWFLLSKQNTWSTIQGIIIHRIPEPWVLCGPLCRKTVLTIADVSGRKRNDYWRNTVLFFVSIKLVFQYLPASIMSWLCVYAYGPDHRSLRNWSKYAYYLSIFVSRVTMCVKLAADSLFEYESAANFTHIEWRI